MRQGGGRLDQTLQCIAPAVHCLPVRGSSLGDGLGDETFRTRLGLAGSGRCATTLDTYPGTKGSLGGCDKRYRERHCRSWIQGTGQTSVLALLCVMKGLYRLLPYLCLLHVKTEELRSTVQAPWLIRGAQIASEARHRAQRWPYRD